MSKMSNKRKLQLSHHVCVLRGARLPSILSRKDAVYALEMLATPEPEINRKNNDTPPEMSWSEALNRLDEQAGGASSFKLNLSWNPLSPLKPSQQSQTGASAWDMRWETTLNALRRQQGDAPREIAYDDSLNE